MAMIYLDNAATTYPKPESVYRAMDRLAREGAGNPGRGMHQAAQNSESAVRGARQALAQLLGVPDPDRIIFGLNATDGLNMAIKGTLRPGDHAVTSDLEHNSLSRPLEGLAREGVITLTRLASDEEGRIDPAAVEAAMTPKTRLIAMSHVSNVLGIMQDAAALAAIAHARGALLLIDAAQSAGVVPMDLEAMQVDLCAFTGHKGLLGPMGTGGLVVRDSAQLKPWREGGTGGDSSSPVQPTAMPHYLEGGTPNAVGLEGLRAGVHYVLERGVEAIAAHERTMARHLAETIQDAPPVKVHAAPHRARGAPGSTMSEMGLVTFTIDGYDPAETAAILDTTFGIAVRAGLHCAPYIHRRRGLFPTGTVRASAGPFTTEQDIEAAAKAILEIAKS